MLIGEFLVSKRLISPEDVDAILRHSQKTGLRFGDAALDLGAIRKEQLIDLFGPDYRTDFFHVDSRYFPETTKSCFSPSELFRWGLLPLGHKTRTKFGFLRKRVLNLGMLSPSRKEVLREVEKKVLMAHPEYEGVQVYLILFDDFLSVLKDHYGVSQDHLRGLPSSDLDPTLALFLGVDPERASTDTRVDGGGE